MENQTFEYLSARDYARVLFRHKGLIFFIVFTAVVMTMLYTYLVLPTFEAESQVLIVAQNDAPMPMAEKLTPLRPGIEVAFVQSKIIKSTTLMSEVAKVLDLEHRPDPTGIRGTIKVKIDEFLEWFSDFRQAVKDQIMSLITGKKPATPKKAGKFEKVVKHLMAKKTIITQPLERTDIISIKARDYDPEMAAKLSNTAAQAYILYNMETQYKDLLRLYRSEHPRMLQLSAEIEEQRKRLEDQTLLSYENIAGKTNSGQVKLLQAAVVPISPVLPKKLINLAIALALSLVVGIGYVFLLEIMDQSIKVPQDIKDALKTRTLGSIPRIALKNEAKVMPVTQSVLNGSSSIFNSSIHSIASEMVLLKKERGAKTILILSAEREDGRTTLALNLANTLALVMHQNVLLVEADLRNPKIQRVLGASSHKPGLSSLADGQTALKDIVTADAKKKIAFVQAGQEVSNPEVFFASKAVNQFFKEARENYDFVLVDTPNLRNYQDAYSLTDCVDGAIFVINTCSTRKHLAKNFANRLEERKIALLGAVLNFREYVIPETIYKKI